MVPIVCKFNASFWGLSIISNYNWCCLIIFLYSKPSEMNSSVFFFLFGENEFDKVQLLWGVYSAYLNESQIWGEPLRYAWDPKKSWSLAVYIRNFYKILELVPVIKNSKEVIVFYVFRMFFYKPRVNWSERNRTFIFLRCY